MGIVPNLGRTGDGGMPPESGEMTGAGMMGATTSREELGARFRVIPAAILKVVATLIPGARIIRDGPTAIETVR
jgi:hypothetical protein